METINGIKITNPEGAEAYAIEVMGKDAGRRFVDIAYSQWFNKLKAEYETKKKYATEYATETGITANGQVVTTLYKTHWHDGTPLIERIYIKSWFDEMEMDLNGKIYNEMDLNDWSRWNTELVEGKTVEVSEYIYYNMLGCVPPRIHAGGYFEVGEPHHYDYVNKKEVHRAFWMENGKYYTGYPKQITHLEKSIL